MRRFRGQPVHRGLLMRAVGVLRGDGRVLGLYVSGSPDTDEYSDVGLMVVGRRGDVEGLEGDRYALASRVGEIRARIRSVTLAFCRKQMQSRGAEKEQKSSPFIFSYLLTG